MMLRIASLVVLLGLLATPIRFVQPARAFGHALQGGSDRTGAITVRLGSEDAITFRNSQGVVTDIDLHVGGADYTVPLQCAGGLRDVHPETAALHGQGPETAEGTFAVLFDIGNEQDRRSGVAGLGRCEYSTTGGRLTRSRCPFEKKRRDCARRSKRRLVDV